MKNKLIALLALTLLGACNSQLTTAQAQTTAFTYQGRLNDGAGPANGSYDLSFALYDDPSAGGQQGGSLTNTATAVSNGLFTVTLDFGNEFPGADRWLEIGVRTNGAALFTTLAPRQALTPTPYAVQAANAASATVAASASSVAAANISGTIPLAQLPAGLVTNGAGGVSLNGTFSGDGAGLMNLTVTGPPTGVTPILAMIWINPATFILGSPSTEAGRGSDEGPQTVVTISKGFWMGHHEVTQGEYQTVIGSNPSTFTGDLNRPVETVSWISATNFCRVLTLSERTAGRLPAGWGYRLPTEAEWEYCCRAWTTTRFGYGDDLSGTTLTNYAWFSVNSGSTTHPVAQKLANAWGLMDMHGNVWEWCQDWYGAYPGGSVADPQGPGSGINRVVRGGSWGSSAGDCRSARRIIISPVVAFSDVGFRVVLSPGQP